MPPVGDLLERRPVSCVPYMNHGAFHVYWSSKACLEVLRQTPASEGGQRCVSSLSRCNRTRTFRVHRAAERDIHFHAFAFDEADGFRFRELRPFFHAGIFGGIDVNSR